MKAKIKINLDKIVAYTFTSTMTLAIHNITSFERWNDDVCSDDDIESITLSCSSANKQLLIFQIDAMIADPILTDDEILDASLNEDYIIIEFEDDSVATFTALMSFYKLGLIDLIDIEEEGKTVLYLKRLNDERDRIDKKLINVGVLFGNFKSPLGIKNIEIDIENYEIEDIYNYVYIPILKRYYYVVDIQLINNKFTRLILKEDVLMSWRDLIIAQDAFITRYEGSTSNKLVDNRRPLIDVLRSEIDTTHTHDTSSPFSLKNITLDYTSSLSNVMRNILITSFATGRTSGVSNVTYQAPSNSGLPNLSSQHSDSEFFRFLTVQDLSLLMLNLLFNAPDSSFVMSILWLPFNPNVAFQFTNNAYPLYIGSKVVNNVGQLVDSTSNPMDTARSDFEGVCPYLVIKDFTYTLLNPSYLDYEPYTNYEIYVPFVGWIKVPAEKLINKRILVYYTMDLTTGLSTAYIYSFTDKLVIWSGSCQIGIKIDIGTTNQLENIRQKQANDNNMILGLISSAISIGIGAVTENPVALAGGVLSAGKTIASNVNANNQIFERASISFGSSDGSLHAPQEVQVRKTYNQPLTIDETVYKHLQGLPYNNYINISNLNNDCYIEVGEIHFDAKGYDIYSTEIDEIVALLKNGVIL